MNRVALLPLLLLTVAVPAQQFRPGRAATIPPALVGQPILDMTTGDVDGDGIDDLIVAADTQGAIYLRANGLGGFDEVWTTATSAPLGRAFGVSLGDYDGDGDLDLAVVFGNSSLIALYRNDNGSFVDISLQLYLLIYTQSIAVRWLDANGDGRLDLFVGHGRGCRLLLGTGASFVDVTTSSLPPVVMGVTQRARPLDIDADGDVDLVFTDASHPVLLRNDGTGRFDHLPATAFPAPTVFTFIAGIEDVDGDGLADLVIDDGSSPRLWVQQANGTFVDATATRFAAIIGSLPPLEAVDVDSDGDLDLVGYDRMLTNRGAGHFVDETAGRWSILQATAGLRGVRSAIGDIDGDGDPDFAFADVISGQICSVNHDRHVSAPRPPALGSTYPIEFEWRPGYGTAPVFAFPWFASARVHLWTPFGLLGVDPGATVFGGAITLAAPVGRGGITLNVPRQPALVGVTFFLQAAILERTGRIVFTNTLRDQIF
ncbi:MAG: VCBS repeat-containing protein [Planctomycetes bacterium]|nr:VCBS repeat-containing protein [Planctomycetota bacterium]